MSATSVLNNLDTEKYDVLPVGITKDGHIAGVALPGAAAKVLHRAGVQIPAPVFRDSHVQHIVFFRVQIVQHLSLIHISAALGITPEQVPGYIAAEVAQAGCGAET